MDENHQDKTESIPPATTTDVSVQSEQKVGMPKHNGVRKRMNPGAKFFKTWATPIGTIVAAIVAVSGFLFGVYQFNTQQQSASQNAVQQQQLTREQEAANAAQTLDQQRQATLDTYLDRMSDLLLISNLAVSKPEDPVRVIAKARTLTAVRNLDLRRKGTLIRFLWEAGLISGSRPVISLYGADLSGADFTKAELIGANLSGANLSGAKFTNADLSGVNTSLIVNCAASSPCGKNFVGAADLSGANLSGANLSGAHLEGANLSGANLSGAVLHGATYNTKTVQVNDAQGNPLTLQPTQWPKGFHPPAGAICDDC